MPRQINLSERIQELEKMYNIVDYKKTPSGEIQYIVTCKQCGTEYKKTYSQLLKGCTRCKKKQEAINKFQQKIDQKFGKDKYKVIEYISSETKAKVKCLRCDSIIEFKPSDLSRKKYICGECLNKGIDSCVENTVVYRERISYNQKINSIISKYEYIICENCNQDIKHNTQLKLFCKKHNYSFTKESSKILEASHPCPKCSKELQIINTRRKNYEKFVQKSKRLFKDKFTYFSFEESKFTKMSSKVKLHCNKHNLDFECEANSHLRSPVGACPHCVFGYRYYSEMCPEINNVFDIETMQRESDKKFGWYKILEYKGRSGRSTLLCKKHNKIFKVISYYHFYSESGACPICYQENNVMFKKKSKAQIEISNYVKNIVGDDKVVDNINILKSSNSDTLKEIDVYIPDLKFGIEYHGLLWHSFGKSKYNSLNNYNEILSKRKNHKWKADKCNELGIILFQIFEDEWLDPIKQSIWKSMINVKLNNIHDKIYARNCEIKEITDNRTIRDFLTYNHVQGYAPSKINIGLYYNNELVSIMTFSSPRYNLSYQYELIRFASKKNTIVVGGASKLFKYFVKKYKPKSIISYANRRWSNGDLYRKLGFINRKTTTPNHFYVNLGEMRLYSRFKFTKNNLKELLVNYDPKKSILKNMLDNDFRIIFDAGNYVFEYIPEIN